MNDKCINCIEKKRCRDSYTSWIFFIIGLIATIAMRVVTVMMHMNPVYGKISWYIGIGGFFIFFMYKYKVTQGRYNLIKEHDIVYKIDQNKPLSREDYRVINGILCSLSAKKERINYFFIFVLSALALIVALYMDLFY